jgi:hypothetical protein
MTFKATIRMLRSAPMIPSAEEWRRKAARVAWMQQTTEALFAAQDAMDERCMAAVGKISEEEFERLCDEEEAKVDALFKVLRAAADHDKWPRHLYWSL